MAKPSEFFGSSWKTAQADNTRLGGTYQEDEQKRRTNHAIAEYNYQKDREYNEMVRTLDESRAEGYSGDAIIQKFSNYLRDATIGYQPEEGLINLALEAIPIAKLGQKVLPAVLRTGKTLGEVGKTVKGAADIAYDLYKKGEIVRPSDFLSPRKTVGRGIAANIDTEGLFSFPQLNLNDVVANTLKDKDQYESMSQEMLRLSFDLPPTVNKSAYEDLYEPNGAFLPGHLREGTRLFQNEIGGKDFTFSKAKLGSTSIYSTLNTPMNGITFQTGHEQRYIVGLLNKMIDENRSYTDVFGEAVRDFSDPINQQIAEEFVNGLTSKRLGRVQIENLKRVDHNGMPDVFNADLTDTWKIGPYKDDFKIALSNSPLYRKLRPMAELDIPYSGTGIYSLNEDKTLPVYFARKLAGMFEKPVRSKGNFTFGFDSMYDP